eukprot:4412034-Pyramimonas_sp.AAC.1
MLHSLGPSGSPWKIERVLDAGFEGGSRGRTRRPCPLRTSRTMAAVRMSGMPASLKAWHQTPWSTQS